MVAVALWCITSVQKMFFRCATGGGDGGNNCSDQRMRDKQLCNGCCDGEINGCDRMISAGRQAELVWMVVVRDECCFGNDAK